MNKYLIIIILVCLLCLFTCNGGSKQSKVIYHTSDTTIVHDTIVDTIVMHHTNILPIHVDRIDLSDTNAFEYRYYYPIKDSLLEGVIIAESNDRPKIDFNYKLKKYHTSTTTTIRDTFNISNHGFLYGGNIIVSPLLSAASFGLSYQNKKGNLIDLELGRDFVNNNNFISLGFRGKF